MAGIEHDPLSDIQNIRRLLDGYTPGFAFLKELVQNADDAKATQLVLAWCPGLRGARHPLLQGPALLAINNGRFTAGDRNSLLRMGLGNKGGDSGKIGKFGLGTKSIFHVAEAFFFLESGGDPALRDILNPWSPRFHSNWDSVEKADWLAVHAECDRVAGVMQSWFAIWIPLRRRSVLDGIDPIRNGDLALPGDLDSCPRSLLDPLENRDPRLGELLPLLRYLGRIEFHDGAGKTRGIEIDRGARHISHDGSSTLYRVVSHEASESVEAWKQLPAWPRVYQIQDNGSEVVHPDKAEWSHGVVLTATSASPGEARLRIYWSVFLPVGNRPFIDERLAEGSRDISLFLHGFFFLNDSRTQIRGLDQHFPEGDRGDPIGICQQWNHELVHSSGGLLPSLLPALAGWHDEGTLSGGEMAGIARRLKASPLWGNFRRSLTDQGSLVYAHGRDGWKWYWIPCDRVVAIMARIESPAELELIKGLTTNFDPEIALAVDLPEASALARANTHPFDAACLRQLRSILRTDPSPTDDEAALLVRILGGTVDRDIPREWWDMPLYRAKPRGLGHWRRVSLTNLKQLADAGDLFGSDPHSLASLLAKAADEEYCPWLTEAEVPSNQLVVPSLTIERGAAWLLGRTSLSPVPDDRQGILRKFVNQDRHGNSELKAIRYLLHGRADQREVAAKRLYYQESDTDSNSLCADAFRVVLESRNETWRLVDPAGARSLNGNLADRALVAACGRENFPRLIRELSNEEARAIDFSGAAQETLDWILTETPEDHLDRLQELRMHHLGSGEMVSASDEVVWLDGQIQMPESLTKAWKALRKEARILGASASPRVYERQKILFSHRLLDPSGALKLAAEADNPGEFWELILYFLSFGTPRADAIGALRSSPWLPVTRVGGKTIGVSPDTVLHLPGMEEVVGEMLANVPNCPEYSSNFLPTAVREAKGWGTLASQILRPPREVLRRLEEIFESAPESFVLGFNEAPNDEGLERWLRVVGACELESLYECRHFLAAIRQNDEWKAFSVGLAAALARPLRGPAAEQLYLCTLTELRKYHESCGTEQARDVLDVYAQYLSGICASGMWDTVKQSGTFRLLNQSRNWVAANKVAFPCRGILPGALLHNRLALALEPVSKNAQASFESDGGTENLGNSRTAEESAENLQIVLGPFIEKLSPKAIAILPALLGFEVPVKRLAAKLLEGISVDSAIEDVIPEMSTAAPGGGAVLRERAMGWKLRARLIPGETVELQSVAGPLFDAPIEQHLDSIFLPTQMGNLGRWKIGNRIDVCLASPERFRDLPTPQLRDIFLESVRVVLDSVYHFDAPDLEAVFDRYAQLGQLSLGICRQEILRSAETQLQILGVRPTGLEEARRLAAEARARFAEAAEGLGNAERLNDEGMRADDESRRLFMTKLEECSETQQKMEAALRRKVEEHQYAPDSIPFEILQNADDAAVELHSQGSQIAPDINSLVSKFVFHIDEAGLAFYYGGRPINDAHGRTGPAAEKWRRDLVKMLLLNGSDKNTGDDVTVTGKFGLGFKSVFLLSNRPQVVSGTLAFEIVGGIWPRQLSSEKINRIRRSIREYFGDYPRATSIHLEAEKEIVDSVTTRFLALAPWTPAFARRLDTVVISRDDKFIEHRWEPDGSGHSPWMRWGKIRLGHSETMHLELFHEDEFGRSAAERDTVQWLFQLTNSRLQPLPEMVPWLWVTVPTRTEGLGFILNAPFALDPGRTRLSKRKEDETRTNRRLFERAAVLLDVAFATLIREEDLFEKLGITEPTTFWTSLWDLMTRVPHPSEDRDPEGAEWLALALWPMNRTNGYSKLIDRNSVIPTKLQFPLGCLTSLPELKFSVSGWLAKLEGCRVLKAAIDERLTAKVNGAAECCSEAVARELHARLGVKLERLRLACLIRGGTEGPPRLAPRLSDLLANTLLFNVEECAVPLHDALHPDELREMESLGDVVLFLSEAGNWVSTDQLLVSTSHDFGDDETLRSHFAPPSRILSSQYSPSAARLFRELRRRLQADAKQLADWIREPHSPESLKFGLAYLAKGDLSREVAFDLGPQWFQELLFSEVFQTLDPAIQLSIKLVFGMAEQESRRRQIQGKTGWLDPFPDQEEEEVIEFADQSLDSKDIKAAWNEQEALRLFTVSGPLRELIAADLTDDQNLLRRLQEAGSMDGKSAWFRLLCLGCTLDMPRGRQPAVAVRGLWSSSLGSEFWSLSAPESLSEEALEEVNRRLDPFFRDVINRYYSDVNASGEYVAFWRRVFYDFRKIHHFVYRNHLPETILDFATFTESDGRSLITFLRSGQVPAAMQDPDHSRFKGVIGQSMKAPLLFVMRELRRIGLLDERFAPACFYMNSPARRIASRLEWIHRGDIAGGDFDDLVSMSETIHKRVTEELPELASFYDLPLQFFAHSAK